jgi:uncharacterized membrane protein YgcG
VTPRRSLCIAPLGLVIAALASGQSPTTKAPTTQTPPASSAEKNEPDKKAAEGEAGAAANAKFSTEQLEQIAAPIALHPDALLMQMCMAATYPIEVVQAARFVEQNPKLAGKELDNALKGKDWDASVKSLCGFKTVLKQMNDNLDWTQDLGDAFLGQQAELLDAVQRLRGKAHESGNLKTSEQQKVTVQEDKTIIIESPSPQVVYVPTYSPTVVYGPTWGYPTYYYPPMYTAGAAALSFTAGMIVGGAMWGGCNWGWGNSEVDIDVDHNYNFNKNTSNNVQRTSANTTGANKSKWQHDPSHRKGAGYKDSATAQRYGGSQGSSRVTQDQARGYDRGPGASTRPSTSTRPSAATRPTGAGAGASRPSTSQAKISSRPSSGQSAYSGSRQPQLDRAASSRGSASRGGGGGSGGGGGGRRR